MLLISEQLCRYETATSGGHVCRNVKLNGINVFNKCLLKRNFTLNALKDSGIFQ